jgi:cytochrome c oxidase subunit 3
MTTTEDLARRFQFATREQQHEVAEVGMWVFLATEILMFGALFTTYSVYRMYYADGFALGSAHNDIVLGAINTAVLLTSSFTMVLAVWSAQAGKQSLIVTFLLLTMLFGTVFLGIKFYEYYVHWQEALVPGFNFRFEGGPRGHVEMFFLFYFIMTGLHAFHMIVGLGIMAVMTGRAALGTFTAGYHTPVQILGLYWHFVDVVWVFLFPLFYLIGRHLH